MTIRLKAALRTVVALSAMAMATAASAVAHQWSFSNASFTDGASATGTFCFDGTNFFDWNIATFRQPGAVGFPEVNGFNYSSATSSVDTFGSGSGGLRLLRNGSVTGNYLELSFNSILDNGGTVIGSALERTMSPGGSDNGHTSDHFVMTSVAFMPGSPELTSPVPEPETLAMGVLGLGLVGSALARRRRSLAAGR